MSVNAGVRGLLGRALKNVFSASWVSGLGLTEGLFLILLEILELLRQLRRQRPTQRSS